MTEKIVDHLCLGFMGLLAFAAAPIWIAGAGATVIVEKALDKIDALHGMATRVEQFGLSLTEQEKIIAEFGPLLELADKVAAITSKAEQKTQELKKSTSELEELAASYQPNADLLEKVSLMITRVHDSLTKRLTGIEEVNLQRRLEVVKQIAEEEQQMELIATELRDLIERVSIKAVKLDQLAVETTLATRVKGMQITNLKKSVEIVVELPEETGVSHGSAVELTT